MATILKKKITAKDSTTEIVKAILTIAEDENSRVLLTEHCDWLETKLKEVARLARILKRRKLLD